MKANQGEEVFRCSFCDKSQEEVSTLVAGPSVFICNECVDICLDIIAEERELKAEEEPISVDSLLGALNQQLIGQPFASQSLAMVFSHHARRLKSGVAHEAGKVNVLLAGPTGSGKTFAVNILAEQLGAPLVCTDALRLSGFSYFKEDNFIQTLYSISGNDRERTARGIVCIEQLDRIASRRGENETGLRIQESLVQVLDGTSVEIPAIRFSEKIRINTEEILFVGCGTFPGLDFRLGGEALIPFGFIPELAARFTVCVPFQPLREREMLEILMKPKGLLDEYRKLFVMEGLTLSFTDDAIQAIAHEAARRQGGARSLRSLLESVALEASSEFAARRPQTEILVDGAFIRGRVGVTEEIV